MAERREGERCVRDAGVTPDKEGRGMAAEDP